MSGMQHLQARRLPGWFQRDWPRLASSLLDWPLASGLRTARGWVQQQKAHWPQRPLLPAFPGQGWERPPVKGYWGQGHWGQGPSPLQKWVRGWAAWPRAAGRRVRPCGAVLPFARQPKAKGQRGRPRLPARWSSLQRCSRWCPRLHLGGYSGPPFRFARRQGPEGRPVLVLRAPYPAEYSPARFQCVAAEPLGAAAFLGQAGALLLLPLLVTLPEGFPAERLG